MRPSSTLPPAVIAVRHGRFVLSEPQWRAIAARLSLSPRELQIVRGVFDDQKEQSIAAHLGISAHTVHTHLIRLYQKLGVSSRVELVVRVIGEHMAQFDANDGTADGGQPRPPERS